MIGFFLQQTRGFFADNVKLLDCRNMSGETPLLRSMTTGNISVIKMLLEEKADPFCIDHQGNSVFTILCKGGLLWAIHFMFNYICTTFGNNVARQLMSCLDAEGHSPLDWAADSGEVNVIEYLIRPPVSMNPCRLDASQRSPLFWAVKSCRLMAARLLVRGGGCNPFQSDIKGQTPYHLSFKTGGRSDLVVAIRSANRCKATLPSPPNLVLVLLTDGGGGGDLEGGGVGGGGIDPLMMLYSPISPQVATPSFALSRINPSRGGHAVAYWFLVSCVWLLAVFVPFYGWGGVVLVGGGVFRHYERKAAAVRRAVGGDRSKLTFVQELLGCPEKGIGVWLGGSSMLAVYLFSCASFLDKEATQGNIGGGGSGVGISLTNPLMIG